MQSWLKLHPGNSLFQGMTFEKHVPYTIQYLLKQTNKQNKSGPKHIIVALVTKAVSFKKNTAQHIN